MLNEIAKIFLKCRLPLRCCINSGLQAYKLQLLDLIFPYASGAPFLAFFCKQVFATESYFVYKCCIVMWRLISHLFIHGTLSSWDKTCSALDPGLKWFLAGTCQEGQRRDIVSTKERTLQLQWNTGIRQWQSILLSKTVLVWLPDSVVCVRLREIP